MTGGTGSAAARASTALSAVHAQGAPTLTVVPAVNANDVVAFLVELAVVVLLAVAGFAYDGPRAVAVLLGVGLPLVAVVLWAAFAAPRARAGRPGLRLLVKVVVLGAGVVAGFPVLPVGWAMVFAVVVAANLVLMYVGPLARRSPDAGAAVRR
jgi:Protein of unknown function (DUF2568)